MLNAFRVLLIWADFSCVFGNDADVAPLTKVVQLLGDLKLQLEQDGQKEVQNYDEYSRWCESQAQDSQGAISGTKVKIEDIESFLMQQEAFREKLASEIHETAAEVASNEADLQEAKAQRANEHEVHMASEDEYMQNTQQLEGAIFTMQKKQPGGGQKPAADLLAVATTLRRALERNPDFQLNEQQQQTLKNFFRTTQLIQSGQAPQMNFLQTGQSVMAPDYLDYQQQASGVTAALQLILNKEKGNRDTALQGEQNAANSFSMVEQSLNTEITEGQKTISGKKSQLAKSEETCSQKQQELEEVKELYAETTRYLNDVVGACNQKAREFKVRTKLRSDELSAVQQAVQILSSAQVQGLATKASIGASFLQVRTTTNKVLKSLHNSGIPALSFLAVRMQNKMISLQNNMQIGRKDPMGEVRKLIEEMIKKLLNEAAEEAAHKEWCEIETNKTLAEKVQTETTIQTYKSQIEEMTQQLAQLVDEMAQFEKDLLEMKQMAAEAAMVREKEKQQALISISEYGNAQNLIGNAISVLQDYYAKNNQASLVQTRETPSIDGQPAEIWQEGTYKADDTAASRVISILQVAQSNYAKLASETQMQEQTSEKEFQSLMNDSQQKQANSAKEAQSNHQIEVKLEGAITRAKADLAGYEKELVAVEAYLEKLKPSCTMTDTYEARKARREEEIKSMQEALSVLNGEPAVP